MKVSRMRDSISIPASSEIPERRSFGTPISAVPSVWIGISVLSGLLIVAVVWVFHHAVALTSTIGGWDSVILLWARRAIPPETSEILKTVFKPWGKGDILSVIALGAALLGSRRLGARILLALLLVGLVVTPLKSMTERTRPNLGENSFPSGDTAAVAAAAVPIVKQLPATGPLAGTIVFGVAIERVTAGYHYPSDVLAGIVVGLLCGLLATFGHPFRRMSLSDRSTVSLVIVAIIVLADLRIGHPGSTEHWDTFASVWGPTVVFLVIMRQLLGFFESRHG